MQIAKRSYDYACFLASRFRVLNALAENVKLIIAMATSLWLFPLRNEKTWRAANSLFIITNWNCLPVVCLWWCFLFWIANCAMCSEEIRKLFVTHVTIVSRAYDEALLHTSFTPHLSSSSASSRRSRWTNRGSRIPAKSYRRWVALQIFCKQVHLIKLIGRSWWWQCGQHGAIFPWVPFADGVLPASHR